MKNVRRHHASMLTSATRRASVWAGMGIVVLGLGGGAYGASAINWNGSSSSVWATGANWVGSTAPINDLATNIAEFDQTGTYANMPNAGTTSVGGVQIGDGTTVAGALTLSGTNLTIGANGITDYAASLAATISSPITLGAAQNWTNNSSTTLTVSGGATNSAGLLAVGGTGAMTISGAIGSGSGGLTKFGTDTVTLSAGNTYTGTTTINSGTIYVNGLTGSVNSGGALTFGGTGTFNFDNTTSTGSKAQVLGVLTSSAGDATVEATRTAAQNVGLTVASQSRTTGATITYETNGGTNGTQNKIVLTGQATGFIEQGTFLYSTVTGYSIYAYNDATGYLRGINYGVDANSVSITASQASIPSTLYVRDNSAITAQTTATFTTLQLKPNSSFSYTLATGATLTVNGILDGNGGNTATITGGTGIQAASNAEMVVRADLSNDTLVIASPVLANGTNLFTKSGAGTVTLNGSTDTLGGLAMNAGTLNLNGAATTVNGAVTVNGGALCVNNGNTTFTGNPITVNTGGVLRITATVSSFGSDALVVSGGSVYLNTYTISATVGSLSDGGMTTGVISDAGTAAVNNTLTVSGTTSTTYGGTLTDSGTLGTGLGQLSLTKGGTSTLTLTGMSNYLGSTTIAGGTLLYTGKGTSVPAVAGAGFGVNSFSTLTLDNTTTNANSRLSGRSIRLGGGSYNLIGNATAPTTETDGPLTVTGAVGLSIVTVAPNASEPATLTFASYSTANPASAGDYLLFRGTGLGSASANGVANIKLTTPPTIMGLNTTSVTTLAFALGDTTATGGGAGFVTYDTNGVRLLNGSEQAANFTGATTSTNVLLNLSGGTTSTAGATVNSLQIGNTSGATQALTFTSGFTGTNGLLFSGTSPITVSGSGTGGTGSSHFAVLSSNTAGVTYSSSITGGVNNNLVLGGAGTLTIAGAANIQYVYTYFDGPGAVTWQPTNLQAPYSYNVEAGTLKLGNGNIGYAPLNIGPAAIVDLSGQSASPSILGDLVGGSGTCSVVNSAPNQATIYMLVNNGSSVGTFSGVISGATSLVVRDSGGTPGTQNLAGVNTYSNGTLIQGGTLNITASGTLGANVSGNSVTVNPINTTTQFAILSMASATNLGSNQTLTVSSSLTALAGVAVTSDFVPTLTSATNGVLAINTATFASLSNLSSVGNGAWYLGSSITTGAFTGSALAAGSGNTYRLGGGTGTLTINGNVLADSSGTKVVIGISSLGETGGTGTVVVGGNNSYTGGTTINYGSTLNVTSGDVSNTPVGSGAITDNGALTASGLHGSLVTSGAVTLAGPAPTLTFDNTAGIVDRWSDLTAMTLPNGTLNVIGNSSTNTTETIGALTFSGVSTIGLTHNTKTVTLAANSFAQSGSGILIVKPSTTSQLAVNEFLKASGTAPSDVVPGAGVLNESGTGANQILPTSYVNSVDKTFVYYDATNGFSNTAFSAHTFTLGTTTASDVVAQAAFALTGDVQSYAVQVNGSLTSSAAGSQRTVNIYGGAAIFTSSGSTHTDINFQFTNGTSLTAGTFYNFGSGAQSLGSNGAGSTGSSIISAASLLMTGNNITLNPAGTTSVFNGPVTVDNGTLQLNTFTALGSASTVTVRNSTLFLYPSAGGTFNQASYTFVDKGTLTYNDSGGYGERTINIPALNFSPSTAGNGVFLTANLNIEMNAINAGAATLNDNTTITVTDAGSTGGAGSGALGLGSLAASSYNLTKMGTARLIINGANTSYAGLVTVNQGTLAVTNLNSLGANTNTAPTINAGGVLEIDVSNYVGTTVTGNANEQPGSAERWATAYARLSPVGGTYTLPQGVSLQLGISTVYPGGISINPAVMNTLVLNGGSIEAWVPGNYHPGYNLGSASSTLGTNVNITLASNSQLGRSGIDFGGTTIPLNINGVISSGTGAYGITKIGPDTVILGGANTFTGDTKVTAGILDLGNQNALQGSTLDTQSVGAAQGTLTFDTNVTGKAFSLGGLKGGNNLVLLNNNATPVAIALTVGGNNQSTTYSGSLSGAGASVIKAGTGTLTLTGSSTYSGGTALNAGSVSISGINNLGAGPITFAGGTLQVTGTGLNSIDTSTVNWSTFNGGMDINNVSNTFTASHAIAGSGSLTKLGAGVLNLSGNNSYTGSTTVNGGTLRAGSTAAFGTNSALVLSGSTVDLAGYANSVGSLAGTSGTITSATAATLSVGGDNTSTSYSGTFTGAVGLSKTGTGTLKVLSLPSTVGVTGGTLQLTAAGSSHTLETLRSLTISGGMLDLTNHDLYISGAAGSLSSLAGKLISSGTNPTTLSTTTIAMLSGSEYRALGKTTIGSGASLTNVSSGDLVGVLAYAGDANLDGKISADDYLALDLGYMFNLTGWTHGDFNQDGTIGVADFAAIDNNLAHQGGSVADGEIALHTQWFGAAYTDAFNALNVPAAVPEPASLALLGVGALALLKRRR